MLYLRNIKTNKILGPLVGKTSNNGKKYLVVSKEFTTENMLIEINSQNELQFDVVQFTKGGSK